MMVKILQILLLLSLAAPSLFPQDSNTPADSGLARYFIGKLVILRIKVPADVSGIDLRGKNSPPVLDRKSYRQRIRNIGTSLPADGCTTITDIFVSGTEIAVLLDGGGYGTRPEDKLPVLIKPKPPEKNSPCPKAIGLEQEIRVTRNRERLINLQRLLERAKEACRKKAEQDRRNYEAEKQRYDNALYQRRIKKGSRITIKNTSTSAVTPEVLMNWLTPYVDFSPIVAETGKNEPAEQPSVAPPGPYFGDWRNNKNDAIRLESGKLRYGYCTVSKYREIFRLDTEQILVVKSLKDVNGAGRFILIKATGPDLKLTFYHTLKDLQTGVNKTEEIWSKQ